MDEDLQKHLLRTTMRITSLEYLVEELIATNFLGHRDPLASLAAYRKQVFEKLSKAVALGFPAEQSDLALQETRDAVDTILAHLEETFRQRAAKGKAGAT
jgi:hypothetical protein